LFVSALDVRGNQRRVQLRVELDGEQLAVSHDSSKARIPPFAEIELEVGRLFLPREADGEPAS